MSKPLSKPAMQDRSRKTRDRLMRALEALLREKTFDEISVPGLAERAGVAVGTVYRRFENKDALIPLLFELWRERSAEQVANAAVEPEAIAETDLRQLLRRQVRRAYQFTVDQAHILRAVHLYGRLRPDLIGDEWKDEWTNAVNGTQTFLELIEDRISKSDLPIAAGIAVYLANTALVDKALYGNDGAGFATALEGDAFADQIADVIYGYLNLPDMPESGG